MRSKLAAPAFLADLYRDLRDRRLLLPAALLVAGIVAVPVVLTESAPPPPAPSAGAAVDATAATPAVLTEEAGIRNYRKRLEALKSKNPFDQKFSGPAPGAGDVTELETGGAPAAGSDGENQAATSPADADAPTDATPPPASRGSTAPSEPVKAERKPGKRVWWTWNVDLAFGAEGAVKQHDGVKPLEMLPSRKNPVVAFLGAGPYGKRATFLVSDEVTANEGDGSCSPSKSNCYFLKLRPGHERRLTIDPEEGPSVTYRLKLRKINAVRVKGPEQ